MTNLDDTLTNNQSWIKNAACGDIEDPDIFFSSQPDKIKEAITICHKCPVRVLCAEYAINEDIGDGIWGGLTELDRRSIKKQKATRKGIPNKQH